jgi:hypothetical protein
MLLFHESSIPMRYGTQNFVLLFLAGESMLLFLKIATPHIVYGAESIVVSKMIKILLTWSPYTLYRSVLFMQDSHCLMTPQVDYSVDLLDDDTDTESSFFASF